MKVPAGSAGQQKKAEGVKGFAFMPIRRSGVSNRSELGLGLALEMARGRKVPWHIAKTIASEVGIANARLQTQGVLSLMTLWEELAQLRKLAFGQYLG